MVTDLGLKVKSKQNEEFQFFLPKGIGFVQFTAMAEDAQGQVWLGTVSSGVYRYNVKSKIFEQPEEFSNPTFISLLTSNNKGEIIVGTWGNGLYIPDNQKYEHLSEQNGLAENKVRCILEDREGNIWIGTNQNGVSCFRGKTFKAYLRSQNGLNNQIGAVLEDKKGNFWFGSNNALYKMTAGSNETQRIELNSSGEDFEVTSLLEDSKGYIWVGTWGAGIQIIEPNGSISPFLGKIPFSEPVTFTEQYIYGLKLGPDARIWITMLRGLSVFDYSINSIRTYTRREGLTDQSTTGITIDGDGRIWVGTSSGGVLKYENGVITPIKNGALGIYPAISSLTNDYKGNIWIGTEGGGIFYGNGELFKQVTINEGLPSNYVSLIELDSKGYAWIGTNKGICRFHPDSGVVRILDKIDKTARIETKPNAVTRDRAGNMWFGTINGALSCSIFEDNSNQIESVTVITAVKVFQDTLYDNDAKLHHKQNYLSFYFDGLCFSDPEKVMFKVKLHPLDKEWQLASSVPFITYNNLPPGDYTFNVVSCNNSGLWNKEPQTFQFVITPPYWMTWWFYTIVVFLLVILGATFIKFRERNLRLETKRLEVIVNLRTEEISLQKEEIEKQRDELKDSSSMLEQKSAAITDSIRYAKRIQLATLPYMDLIKRNLPQSFVLYKPKDIVSGDFYAFAKKENKILIAAADCTGHGVPGAFMSMIGSNLYNQIIIEKNIVQPAMILDQLNIGIEQALKQDETDNHDGMDMAIISLDFEKKKFEYSGANRPLWIIRKGYEALNEEPLIIVKPDKNPIGGFKETERKNYTNNEFEFNPGDTVYIFTDGFADQFGGPDGKKLLSKRFREFLLTISHFSMVDQERELDNFFEKWKGNLEQVDDILVIGIKYPEKMEDDTLKA
jgi:ligand-binding sensor domain-containing protein/serine phosphatase RsbU (regulator of sigma subunit)